MGTHHCEAGPVNGYGDRGPAVRDRRTENRSAARAVPGRQRPTTARANEREDNDMNVHSIFRHRQLALAATAAFTFGIGSVVTAAGAGASPERGTRRAIRSATVRDDTLTIT